MYRIAICDDHQQILELLSHKIKSYCLNHSIDITIYIFSDSISLIDLINDGKQYDAYILDIVMPHHSGMDIVERIKAKSQLSSIPIIFITAYEQYAIKACGMNLCGYILKDNITQDLNPILNKLFLQLAQLELEKVYVISNQRKYIKIAQNRIIYIYKNHKNSVFVLKNGTNESERITLQETYNKLNNPDMYFLDRCSIINIKRIDRIDAQGILMDNGHLLQSSKSCIAGLKSYLSSYWSKML